MQLFIHFIKLRGDCTIVQVNNHTIVETKYAGTLFSCYSKDPDQCLFYRVAIQFCYVEYTNFVVTDVLVQAYKHLYQAMLNHPEALERPPYWQELVNRPEVGKYRDKISLPPSDSLKSKL